MRQGRRLGLPLLLLGSGLAWAAPPSAPQDLALYQHCQDWLKNFPSSYIATNVRGEDLQYKVRRQAALDMLRQRRDFGTVYELMVDLDRGSFLSDQIMDVLVEWKSRRAIPLLQALAADKARPKNVREKARAAAATLVAIKPDAPPVFQ